MTLVITSKSTQETRHWQSLRTIVEQLADVPGEEVRVLCYADAVYNLIGGSPHHQQLADWPATFYASVKDVDARGIQYRVAADVTAVDYPDMVDLIFAADRVISWT